MYGDKYPNDGKYAGITYYLSNEMPADPVECKVGDRWYIKMGFVGFNSKTNIMIGYDSEAAALAAIRRYQAK